MKVCVYLYIYSPACPEGEGEQGRGRVRTDPTRSYFQNQEQIRTERERERREERGGGSSSSFFELAPFPRSIMYTLDTCGARVLLPPPAAARWQSRLFSQSFFILKKDRVGEEEADIHIYTARRACGREL